METQISNNRISANRRAAFRFFQANAGFIVGRAAEYALSLARAEEHASAHGWYTEWRHDDEGMRDWHCHCGCQPSEVLACILYDGACNVLASLWGIGDPDRSYRRVVEAELASEALAELGNSWIDPKTHWNEELQVPA